MSNLSHMVQAGGKPSGTKTWFTIASAITLFRFAVADLTLFGTTFGPFDSAGAAMLLSVFGATYVARQNVTVGKGNAAKPDAVP